MVFLLPISFWTVEEPRKKKSGGGPDKWLCGGGGGRGWLLINVLIANLIWTSLHASDKGQINPNMNDTYRKAIAQNRDGIKTHLSIRCILVTFWLLYNVGCGVSLGAEGFSWVELIVDCWEGRLSEEWQRCAQGVYTLYKLMCSTRLDTSFCVFKYFVPLYCMFKGWASRTRIWYLLLCASLRCASVLYARQGVSLTRLGRFHTNLTNCDDFDWQETNVNMVLDCFWSSDGFAWFLSVVTVNSLYAAIKC